MAITTRWGFPPSTVGLWLMLVVFASTALAMPYVSGLVAPAEGVAGVAVVVLIFFWLTRQRVRDMFDR
jgi:hypothetical protein